MPLWLGMADLPTATTTDSPPSVDDVSVLHWWAASSRRTTVLMSPSRSVKLTVTVGFGRSMVEASELLVQMPSLITFEQKIILRLKS